MIRPTSRLLAVAAILAAGGCGDIGAPLRTDIYEWRITSGADTLSFHWPRTALPVRFWAENTLDLPAHTSAAIDAWKAAFLYREFDGTLVADSAQADVIVTRGFPPAGGGILVGRAAECEALTDLELDAETKTLELPVHIYVAPRFDPSLPATQACLGLVMIHEMGHSIGIFRHSLDPADIMYFNPTVTAPSERDRQTAEVAYHAPVTVTTTRGGQP